MRIGSVLCVGLVIAGLPVAAMAADCSNHSLPQALPIPATMLPPLSRELPTIDRSLGMTQTLFTSSADDSRAVDVVLARLRAEACSQAAPAGSAAAYVPRTKWDNTPYRFSAGGNGKKFTAADFDAWMKANGIHVAKGVPQPVQSSDGNAASSGASEPPPKQ